MSFTLGLVLNLFINIIYHKPNEPYDQNETWKPNRTFTNENRSHWPKPIETGTFGDWKIKIASKKEKINWNWNKLECLFIRLIIWKVIEVTTSCQWVKNMTMILKPSSMLTFQHSWNALGACFVSEVHFPFVYSLKWKIFEPIRVAGGKKHWKLSHQS